MEMVSQILKLSQAQMRNIERDFVDSCIREGVTCSNAMVLIATRTLRHINKDMVAGYKAGYARKRNARKMAKAKK